MLSRLRIDVAWYVDMVLLLAFVLIAGWLIVGVWIGALIDERNKVSLSRLQLTVWTVVVVSAFFVAAMHNITRGQKDPLAIQIPTEVWALLGISATSLIGAGLIKQEKAKLVPEQESAKRAISRAAYAAGRHVEAAQISVDPKSRQMMLPAEGNHPEKVLAQGVLGTNSDPSDASLLDMFRTEELGNLGRLDLAKIQMFYFTVVMVITYSVALREVLMATGKVSDFPAPSATVVGLLGLSHAAYLTTKAIGGSTATAQT